MTYYISTPRLITRTLFHFAIFPYVVGIFAAPAIVYFLIRSGVDIQGNILKLYSEMGITSEFEIYAFSTLLIFALLFPLITMAWSYSKFKRFGQLSFVVTLYILVPLLIYGFFQYLS